jgi:hypothetical protein
VSHSFIISILVILPSTSSSDLHCHWTCSFSSSLVLPLTFSKLAAMLNIVIFLRLLVASREKEEMSVTTERGQVREVPTSWGDNVQVCPCDLLIGTDKIRELFF